MKCLASYVLSTIRNSTYKYCFVCFICTHKQASTMRYLIKSCGLQCCMDVIYQQCDIPVCYTAFKTRTGDAVDLVSNSTGSLTCQDFGWGGGGNGEKKTVWSLFQTFC